MCAGPAILIDDPDAALARLAALDLAAAEEAHADYMTCERGTPQKTDAGRTYQRMARSLRQTLVTQARLKARAPDDRETRDAARAEAVQAKKAEVRRRMGPVIRLESESEAQEQELLYDLESFLAVEAQSPCFLDRSPRALVVHLCGDLDIAPPQAGPDIDAGAPEPAQADSS